MLRMLDRLVVSITARGGVQEVRMQKTWHIAVGAALLGVCAGLAPAQGAWRCLDELGQSECQEALINDIEDLTVREWPHALVLTMPPLPYTCVQTRPGPDHWPGTRPPPPVIDELPWSISWTGDLRRFLIGRVDAAARLAGTVEVSTWPITAMSWPDTTITYVFEEGATEVQAPSGPTGVRDLGSVRNDDSTWSGELWTSHLHIVLSPPEDGTWVCRVGPEGLQVREEARNNAVKLDYPLAWTAVQDVLAEGVRAQFRRSVRIAVTGTP
jgi:hypothetical protein